VNYPALLRLLTKELSDSDSDSKSFAAKSNSPPTCLLSFSPYFSGTAAGGLRLLPFWQMIKTGDALLENMHF